MYGLLPFVVSAVALWLSPFIIPQYVALDFHQVSLIYGGIIASYLSGLGAGAMMSPDKTRQRSFLPSILITLVAFFIILPNGTFFLSIGAAWRQVIILMLLVYLYLRDVNGVALGHLPRWYGDLRARLTLWASISIMLIAGRLAIWGFY